MSSNGPPSVSVSGVPSAAADVSFSSLAHHQNGESSSQAESRSSGKRSSRSYRKEEDGKQEDSPSSRNGTPSDQSQRPRRSGGFLLESSVGNGYPSPRGSTEDRHGKRKVQDGSLQIDKRRLAQSRLSGDSSLGSSPLSREVSMDGTPVEAVEGGRYMLTRPQSMDPAQLVQMALNLSESRKRHVSGPLNVPLSSPRGARVASGPSRDYGTTRERSPRTHRQSYLSEDVEKGPLGKRSVEEEGNGMDIDQGAGADELIFNFSPATLSRAEKARKYFELGDEHRRLLQYLPPLKPDASAPGNYNYTSTGSPGTPYSEINRVPSYANNKHHLGRSYNPLQALRNRRLRARERRSLQAPPDTWTQTDRTKHWIDDVAAATGDPQYRQERDRVDLPPFDGDAGGTLVVPDSPKGHRRTGTVESVITRPENGWNIEPPELLADAYWVEAGDNKALIEDRQGASVFPQFLKGRQVPRKSGEDVRVVSNGMVPESRGEDSEKPSHHRRHLLRGAQRRLPKISRSVSSSSEGSVDERRAAALSYGSGLGEENIGPLQRHMQEMIAKEERGEPHSPDVVSPDHWDSRNTPFPAFKDDGHRDSMNRANSRLTVDTQFQHRRSRSADARFDAGGHAMSSNDDVASQEPTSPLVPGFTSSMGTDLTPPSTRKPDKQKSKLHRIPLFRSHSKDRNHIEHTDFAASTTNGDPEIKHDRPRTSMDSLRPPQVQRLKTTDSYASSLRRLNTSVTTASTTDGSVKDSGSTVGRFFKGGRIGDMVRNEGSRLNDRIRGRDRGDAPAYLDSASTIDEKLERKPTLSPTEETDTSPEDTFDRGGTRPTFNLPSFTSPALRNRQRAMSVDSDPLSRRNGKQTEAERETRPAPPQIHLPEDDLDVPTEKSGTFPEQQHRKSYGFLDQGLHGVSSSPFAPLEHRRDSQFAAHARRHWSISDKAQPEQASKVTMRDVARVKALLLSSGIKARELQRRADTPREEPLPLMVKAAGTAGTGPERIPRKDELLAAAQLLSNLISSTVSQFEDALGQFQNKTAPSLASQLDELQHKATGQLTVRVHETSDDADAFNVELTTKQPQDIKRVDDAVDAMLRRRRRQFRLIRRAGFKLLEWLVLGIMWWVWFLVVLFNAFRRIVLGMVALVRWVLWF